MLADIGSYQIQYQIAVKDANKLVIGMENLNSLGNIVELPYTIISKNAVDSFFINSLIINTTTTNNIISIRNPITAINSLNVSLSTNPNYQTSNNLTIVRLN